MQSNLTLILSTPPSRLREVQGFSLPIAHMAYRIGCGPHLLCSARPNLLREGLMVVDDRGFDGGGKPDLFCREVLQECTARRFSGVICDWEAQPSPSRVRILEQLCAVCHRRGLPCYVPESYGPSIPQARVLLSSALSGGTLSQRLEEAAQRFGRERVTLAIERTASDFSLPALHGMGQELSPEELEDLRKRLSPSIFFSAELCAQYFTYHAPRTGPHFVLFDNGPSIRQKLIVASKHKITSALLAYPQVEDLIEDLLSPPRNADTRT